ncbi:MAG: hypothetical protein FJY67_08735 [Calditrichaeota bacterium]|nr:hypothetical protein [Calditrichota bacterium]
MNKYFPLFAAGLIALVGCTITDPTADLEVRVTMPSTGAVIGGQIKDSFGRMITSQVTINVGGPDSLSVVDLLNNRTTRLTTQSGFVVMAINDTLPVSNALPKRLLIYAEADGYLPAAAYLEVANQQSSFEIRMVSTDVNNLPPGVQGVQVGGTTSNNGILTSPLNVTPPPAVGSGAATTLTIGAGSRFVTASGQPLRGDIDVTFIHGNLASDNTGSAQALIPGGPLNIRTESGEPILPITSSLLYAVDENGRTGTLENGSIDFSTQIPGGTLNPRTGTNFVAGDTIALYNSNEEGAATGGTEGILEGPDGSGNFTVRFTGLSPVPSRKSGQFVISGADGAFENWLFLNLIIALLGLQDNFLAVLVIWPAMDEREVFLQFAPDRWYNFSWRGIWGKPLHYNLGSPNNYSDTTDALMYRLAGAQFAEEVSFPVCLRGQDEDDYAFPLPGETANVHGRFNEFRNILTISDSWPFPEVKTITVHVYGKMPEGRKPSDIQPSGLYAQIADAADTSRWRSIGAVQQGRIAVSGLEVGKSYYFKGTYTFRGQTRTANTPWTRRIEANTDTLQYWYQLNRDEANDYERGG